MAENIVVVDVDNRGVDESVFVHDEVDDDFTSNITDLCIDVIMSWYHRRRWMCWRIIQVHVGWWTKECVLTC